MSTQQLQLNDYSSPWGEVEMQQEFSGSVLGKTEKTAWGQELKKNPCRVNR